MDVLLVWGFAAFSCLGLGFGWWHFQASQKLRQHLNNIQSDLERTQVDLENKHQALNAVRATLQELLDHPPDPTDARLAHYLPILAARVFSCIEHLEEWRINSVEPLQTATDVANNARVVERKERFTEYCLRLIDSNAKISHDIDQMLTVHPLLFELADFLKAGHLNIDHPSIVAIGKVIDALRNEPPDDHKTGILFKETDEVKWRRKGDDRLRDMVSKERESSRAAASAAFSRYKLPPLTALDKFRSLKPTGQRDGFS